jgi:hypothetical protein
MTIQTHKKIVPKQQIYTKSIMKGGANIVTWVGIGSVLVALLGGVLLVSGNKQVSSLVSFEAFKQSNAPSKQIITDFVAKDMYASLGQIMLTNNIVRELSYEPYDNKIPLDMFSLDKTSPLLSITMPPTYEASIDHDPSPPTATV